MDQHRATLTSSFRTFLAGERRVPKRSKIKLCNTVEIRTGIEGFNSGRSYYIQCESDRECLRVAADLRSYSAIARRHFQLRTPLQRFRQRLKSVYDSRFVQGLVGLLIVAVRLESITTGELRGGTAKA